MGSLEVIDLDDDDAIMDLTGVPKSPPESRPPSPEGIVDETRALLVSGPVPSLGLITGGVSAAGGTSGLGDGVGAFRQGGTPSPLQEFPAAGAGAGAH
eukprot:6461668-Amphidinium_carterae.1